MSYNTPIDFNDIPQIQNGNSNPNYYDILESTPKPKSLWPLPDSKETSNDFPKSFELAFFPKNITSNNNNNTRVSNEVKDNIKKRQNNNISNTDKKTTGENTLPNKIVKLKRIIKNTKNMGRKKKGNSIKNILGQKLNNKYRHDNVRIRYKRAFTNYLIEFINLKIDHCSKLKEKGRLQKLHKDIIEKTKK